MKASFYKKLQEDFIIIRSLHYQDSFDQERYDLTVSSIRDARKKIVAHSPHAERKVLLYCIDTLFEILNEGDNNKIFDFTDAIHNIPEIYMQKRNLYSFREELTAFQKKYGKHYFAFIYEIKPLFTKRAPKNKWEYFFAASDEDFKRLHPIGYKFLLFIGITAFLLPFVIYSIYILLINPSMPKDVPLLSSDFIALILGFIGTFTVGIGLFNIVAAWIHQYLGHMLTVVCLLGGTAITLFSMYLIYA